MDPAVERYNGLHAKAVVMNSGTSCAIRIRPVWSEYVGLALLAVMYVVAIVFVMVSFMDPIGQWGWSEWLMLVFVTVACGLLVWGQAQRVIVTEVRANRDGLVVQRRLFGVSWTYEIKNGALENVRWHAEKDLKGWPWHSFLQVALPSGEEIMLANELSFMDERFGDRVMGLISEATGWSGEVKRMYVEPPRPGGDSGP